MDDWTELARKIAELCVRTPASSAAESLARQVSALAPVLAFRVVLARGGWYRLGGLVDAEGKRVADDLEQWIEAELAERGDDIGLLCDDYAESGHRATRLNGKTRYLMAATGPRALDFIQLEIEELQEMVSHELFDSDWPPTSIEELVDPRPEQTEAAALRHPTPLGPPFLALRRLTHVADFVARMAAQKPGPRSIQRFFEHWESSSAGAATQFSNHWVLAVREHLDRYRQPILHATPVAAMNGAPPRVDGGFGAKGLALHDALQRYDKAIGYPMAWFFHMATGRNVPHALAAAVIEDFEGGFNYLPDRDARVIKDWLYAPYSF